MFHVILGDDCYCWKRGNNPRLVGRVWSRFLFGWMWISISIDSREVVGFNAQGRWWLVLGRLAWKCARQLRSETETGQDSVGKDGHHISGWWQLIDLLFSPRTLGKMNPFWLIFFRRVGEKPPTRFLLIFYMYHDPFLILVSVYIRHTL